MDDDCMAQFLAFAEAKILLVATSTVSLKDLLKAYDIWWAFEGKRSGTRPLSNSEFQECLNQHYGFKYSDTTYRGLYVSYA